MSYTKSPVYAHIFVQLYVKIYFFNKFIAIYPNMWDNKNRTCDISQAFKKNAKIKLQNERSVGISFRTANSVM